MKVFFHIGYPRTGSTFIQKYLFEKHSEINYLGPKYYDLNFKPYLTDTKMLEINNLKTDKEINLINSNSIFADLNLDKKKINLISSEKFLTFGINYYQNLDKIKKLIELQNKEVVFKVFFVIRNQYDAIKSYYHHAFSEISERFKIKDFNELLKFNKTERNTYNEELNFIDNYHYDITLKKLKNSFDEKNIKIFLYEELYKNKSNFSQNISNFLMINSFETKKLLNNDPINELITEKDKILIHKIYFSKIHRIYTLLKLKKIIPKFLRDFIKKIFTKKVDYKITNHQKNEFKKIFKKSNLILQNDYKINLPEEYF